MKKLLLSLTLLVSVMFGHAQVILNELYTDPNSGNNEFFELYNTSITPQPISLDCYTLVTLYSYSSGNKNYTGAYVLDLPNISIPSKSWVTGASNNPFGVQQQSGVKPTFSWNSLVGTTGSLKKYQLNTTNNDAASLANASFIEVTNDPTYKIPANFNDLFSGMQTGTFGGAAYAVFLFNNNTYVNGFLGKYSSTLVPNTIQKLKTLVSTTSCGTFTLDWSTVKIAEYQGQASGSDNGYARQYDGACGSWVKTASPKSGSVYTPGYANGSATGSTAGFLVTEQTIVCGNKLYFKILSTTDQNAIPVTVQLYEDVNKNGILDATDIIIDSKLVTGVSSTTAYYFDLPDATKKYLVVYNTQLGCLDKVAIPSTASVTLTTTQKNICDNRIDFSISATSADAAAYGLPVTVQLYQDNGVKGVYEAGTDIAIGNPVSVSTIPSATQSISIPEANKGQNILIVYQSAQSCYYQAAVPAATIPGTVTTTQKNICGNRVDYTITGGTGDAATYALPVTVELHYDLNNNGQIDAGEETVQASQTVTSFSPVLRSITNPDPTQNIVLVYRTAQSCFSKTATPAAIAGSLTTTQTNTCGKRIDYAITGGSGDAVTYALPVTVEFRKASDNSLLNSTQVTSFSNTTYSYNVVNPQSVVVVYKPAAACLGNITATPAITSAAIEVGGDIVFGDLNGDGTRTVNYFVQSTSTDAAAFPVQLTVYEDVNKDGIYNTGDKVIGQQTINSMAENGKYTAKITNPNSYAIIKAVSIPTGCATTQLAIDNSNAPIVNLPVHFASFAASRNQTKVNLAWSTASEQNNRGFNVQRNTGSGWKTIAFVFSQATGGNSSSLLAYAYKETNTEKGITQYRLQQVDMDDRASYSEVRTVAGMDHENKVGVYPNPSDDGNINVVFGEASMRTVLVNDAAGRLVKEYKNVTGNTLAIEALHTGFYTLKVIDLKSGSVAIEKVIIKKR